MKVKVVEEKEVALDFNWKGYFNLFPNKLVKGMVAYKKTKAESNDCYLYDFVDCVLGGADEFSDDNNIGKFAIPKPIDLEETMENNIDCGNADENDEITEEVKRSVEKYFSSLIMPNELTETYGYDENEEAIEDIDFGEAQLTQIIHDRNGEIKKVIFTF